MLTLQRSAAQRVLARTQKVRERREVSPMPAVSAEQVKEMLQEIAFVLHATRVVRRMGQDVALHEER